MNWQKFQSLSRSFREMQLQLLVSATPESMDLKGLSGWGKLVSNAIAYSYKVEADESQSEDVRLHWGEIKRHAVYQLERSANSVAEYIAEAEEIGPWERCQIFALLSLCSQTFQDESDAIRLAMEALGQSSSIPSSVSPETLAKLAEWKSND